MTAPRPASTVPSTAGRWGVPLAAWLAVVAVLLVVYRDTLAGMVALWQASDTFAHGFLVAPISLWLAWRKRHELARLTPRAEPWALLPIALAGALWLAGELVVVNAARQFAVVGLLVLSVPAVLGRAVARGLAFPLLFLFFAVPFGEFMLPSMMQWTADFVVLALRITGVPVYQEGMFIIIPSGQWSVVEECSGVRYLIASFMVGTLFAHLNYRSTRRRAIFMGVSVLVPIVANWLRAYLIVMIGHLSGNKLAVGVDHLIYGWVFFGVVILVMFVIGARWAEYGPANAPESGATAALATPTAAFSVFVLAALAGLVSLAPHGVMWQIQRAEAAETVQALGVPAPQPGWAPAAAPGAGWEPGIVHASAQARAAYAGTAGTVGVHLAYFRGQNDERKLVTSSHRLVTRDFKGWGVRAQGSAQASAGGQALNFARAEILGPEGLPSGVRTHLVAWKAYWIDGRFVAGDAQAKLVQAWARLRGRGDDGAIVVFYANEYSVAASEAALQAFVTDHLAPIDALLQHARSSGRSR